MNHEEKLYNSFRIAKSDILKNQRMINHLNSRVIDLSEMLLAMQADQCILAEMLQAKSVSKKPKKTEKVRYGLVNQHVVRRKEGWAVLSANAKKAAKIYPKKTDAVAHATKLAEQGKVCAVIHNTDGTITRKDCR